MGRFKNTTYRDTIDSIVSSVKDTLNNPYYLWANKSPTFVDYYNISKRSSTLDEGSSIEYSQNGINSPLRFNKIKDFVIYGIEQIQISLINEDYGLQGDVISGEGFVLPNTIEPIPGDYFVITYLKEKYLFNITEVSFDTLDNGSNMYKFTYELSPYSLKDLEKNVVNNYTFVVQYVGTDFNSVIRNDVFDQIETIDKTIEILKEYFVTLYYNERVQTFIFRFLENNFYDPYMIEFLINNNIINNDGSEYVYIGHQTQLKSTFPIEYRKTFFHALEEKDLNGIRNYKIKAMGYGIKNRMSVFYNRPEIYFELTYETITKDWGIVPTFFEELIDHIESGELFTENDGNFYIYNLIIKYFNDLPINMEDLSLVEKFDFQYHHMLFYALPAIIFCLNRKLDQLMQKEQ